jgi:hypothetical protein
MQISNKTPIFSLISDPIYTHIDDEIVVMGPNDELYYALNPVGTELWNLLELKPHSLEALTEHLQQIYEVTQTQASEDVALFIEHMMDKELIVQTTYEE